MAEQANGLWAEYRADLVARKLWTRPRARTLDRLVRAVVEFHQLHPQAVAVGPVATAENGNQFFAYTWAATRQLSDQIAKLEKALMFTPESVDQKGTAHFDAAAEAAADEFLTH